MTTGWVYHELYMWHDTGRATTMSSDRKWMQAWEHYENPETKRRFRNLGEIAGLVTDLVAVKRRMATADETRRCHTGPTPQPAAASSSRAGLSPGERTPT